MSVNWNNLSQDKNHGNGPTSLIEWKVVILDTIDCIYSHATLLYGLDLFIYLWNHCENR